MTQDEINEMVKQVGFHGMLSIGVVMDAKQLKAFAQLVAEREREACAKEADKRLHDYTMLLSNPPQNGAAWSIASAIRARKQT